MIYDCLGFLGAWKKGVGRQMEGEKKKKKREKEKMVNRNQGPKWPFNNKIITI